MHSTQITFLANDRIAELMRASSDIHRRPDGASLASRLVATFGGPRGWLGNRRRSSGSEPDASVPDASVAIPLAQRH